MKLIRITEILKIVPLSRTTLWRMEKHGKFPARKKLGGNSVAWLESDILNWISSLDDNQPRASK